MRGVDIHRCSSRGGHFGLEKGHPLNFGRRKGRNVRILVVVDGRIKVEKEDVEPRSHDFHFLPDARYWVASESQRRGKRDLGAEGTELHQSRGEGNCYLWNF